MTTFYDDLLVNGVSLGNKARRIERFDSFRKAGARRGENIVLPRRDGEVWQPKPTAGTTLEVGIVLLDVDPTTGLRSSSEVTRLKQMNDNYRTLMRLLDSARAPLTLTRKVAFLAGNEDHTATAELVEAVDPVQVSPTTLRLALSLRILDGVWLGPTTNVNLAATASQVLNVAGDTHTYEVVLTFPAGAPCRLTNSTTGCYVGHTDTSAYGHAVGVKDMKFSRQSVEGYLNVSEWSGDPWWMLLAPGNNTLVRSSSSGVIPLTYKAAYL